VVRPFVAHPAVGDTSEFRVDQRHEALERFLVAFTPGDE
jgi:hypothetical protein